MSERVRAARAAGREIISLASGDPNLPTDPRIIEAAAQAMRDGQTHYSSPVGERRLREAVVQRERSRAKVTYDPDDVLVTPGGKFAILTALMGIVEQGDEVLIPTPGWVSYKPCVRLTGATAVPYPVLEPCHVAEVRGLVTPRTRAIIVNSPSNPTGHVMGRPELETLVEIAAEHDLWIIFDQVYADLVYDGTPEFPQSIDGGFERTLVVDSLSKSFSMTGWRLGYLATPGDVVGPFSKFVQHSVYCVPAFIQTAGVRALELGDELLPTYRALFQSRMTRAVQRLQSMPGVTCAMPEASMHLFPHVEGDVAAVSRRWLDECAVAVLPGTAFGDEGDGHLRLSLTCPDEQLDIALDRIARAGIE